MSTLDRLKAIIVKIAHASGDEIRAETPLKDVRADSLHWLQIIIRVEGDFNIEIDFDRMRELTTVGDFAEYIEASAA